MGPPTSWAARMAVFRAWMVETAREFESRMLLYGADMNQSVR
jgi:hypothetical protein